MSIFQIPEKIFTSQENDFYYDKDGSLWVEDVPVQKIIDKVGSPFYCYSAAGIQRCYESYTDAFSDVKMQVCYSVKANFHKAVITHLKNLGCGADVTSAGELYGAIDAGIPAERIVFAGVSKNMRSIEYAIKRGIQQFNMESWQEAELINEAALKAGIKAKVAFRINPDVDAMTLDKISTGRYTDKFGIAWKKAIHIYERAAAALPGLDLRGIAVHIGSQIKFLGPYRIAYERILELMTTLKEKGFNISNLDLGGGLAIQYDNEKIPSVADYAAMVKDVFKDFDGTFMFEPGRSIVGNAGILVTQVVALKENYGHQFAFTDANMTDLARPALYNAYHKILPVKAENNIQLQPMNIAGGVCESTDIFAENRPMPRLRRHDHLAIFSAGAYGASMASRYNGYPFPAEVFVQGDQFSVITEQETFEDMYRSHKKADWQ